jgi:ubiquinone/menaquinone biosynthesis C-methylase UbiE
MGQSMQPVTPERITRYFWAFAFPLIMKAAADNGIFDALKDGPLTVEEICSRTQASPRGTSAIVEALAGMELLQKEDGRYRMSEDAATFLVSDKPAYFGGMLFHLTEQLLPNWMQLGEITKTGRPVAALNQENDGAAFFEKFVEALFYFNFGAACALGKALAPKYAGRPVRVLDIAAGPGVWGIGITQALPQAQVTALDFARVLETTKRCVERVHLTDQFTFVPGNALEADPGSGFDIAVLGHILHSEGAERSRQLLKRVFDQLAPGGTVAIAEFLLNQERTGPMNSLIFNVNMLVHTDAGAAYSFEDLKQWLEAAGFIYVRTLEAPAPSPLVLAEKK